jgi:uncharacterized membrane protein YkoI
MLAILFVLSSPVLADEDGEEARRLSEAGKIMPLERILDQVRTHQAGEVLEAELDRSDDGRYIYELEVLDAAGQVWELELDARDGTLLKHSPDD